MINQEIEEGQIVLCTVNHILGTTVFVKLEDYNIEGTITTSEIAPGRIRNLRDYVVPGKKIACKILSIRENKVQLSLRRVKPVERKELLDKIEKIKSYKAILKTVLGEEESKKTISDISEEYSLLDFFENIKENPELLKKYLNKEQSEKIIKILESKKEKEKEIKHIFRLSNKSNNGIIIIKNILNESCKGTKCSINYLAAGKYALSQKGDAFKKIKTEINKVITQIEDSAKKTHSEFLIEKN
jgi:translation initiation factor 2 alpha subunit (eIF-2alpha)